MFRDSRDSLPESRRYVVIPVLWPANAARPLLSEKG